MSGGPVVYSPFRMWLRKMGISLNVLFGLVLMGFLWVVINHLAARHVIRFHPGSGSTFSLSKKTQEVLKTVDVPVTFHAFIPPEHSVYNDVHGLLREYQAAAPAKISVRFIDRVRDIAKADALLKEYRLPSSTAQDSFILITRGDQRRVLPVRKLSTYDEQGRATNGGGRRKAFVAEQWFTSAIYGMTQGKRPVVYMLAGHGEHAINDFDEIQGFSEVDQLLQRENFLVRTHDMHIREGLPADADLLILAGPTERFPEDHLAQLQAYMIDHGRMLLLLDSMVDTGLEPFLDEWGLRLKNQVVVDPSKTHTGREIFITRKQFGEHPITESLQSLSLLLYSPRPIDPLADAGEKQLVITPLAMTTNKGEARRAGPEVESREFNPVGDRKGQIVMACAVERGPGDRVDVALEPPRMVVVGDSGFATNARLRAGAIDFLLNSVNWLVDREQLLEVSPKPVDRVLLVMSREKMEELFWFCVAGLPGTGAVIGFVVWMRRRR